MTVACGIQIDKVFQGFRWTNAYRVMSDDLSSAALAAGALLDYEQAFTWDEVQFVQKRTWVLNSGIDYDFITVPLSGEYGHWSSDYPPATPQTVVFMQFHAPTGRPGKKFYRYALDNGEVFGQGDHIGISLRSGHAAAIDEANENLFVALTGIGVELLIGGDASGIGARNATSASFGGARDCDVHHGWFNKAY